MLIYLVNTGPEISFAVGVLSRFMHNPPVPHLQAIKHVLCYVKASRIHKTDQGPIYLLCDNPSTLKSACNLVCHGKLKHIEMWLHYIRENMLTRIVDLFYISTQDQIADIFTKVLEKNKFTNLRNEMGIKKSEFIICIPCFLYCTKLLVNITPKSRYLPLTIQPSTVYLRTTLMSNSVETWAITIIHQGNRLLRQLPSASPSPIGIRIHE
uniref:Reverse transcriptase Ty1/copia-type domain-containing protein n=1 Tax=Physcomitrium patens TaxID=3218 RepID=A0A2K1JQ17_PHYPA|nr:hypothetical protein PHYPA_016015 [Physcomitrium patens]